LPDNVITLQRCADEPAPRETRERVFTEEPAEKLRERDECEFRVRVEGIFLRAVCQPNLSINYVSGDRRRDYIEGPVNCIALIVFTAVTPTPDEKPDNYS